MKGFGTELAMAVGLALLAGGGSAWAASMFGENGSVPYNGTGSWHVAGNWNGGLPDSSSLTYVRGGRTVVVTNTAASSDLTIGYHNDTPPSGYALIQDGAALSSPTIRVGYNTGPYTNYGSVFQSGGSVTVSSHLAVPYGGSSAGSYTGEWTQVGGSVSATEVDVGYNGIGVGRYTLGGTGIVNVGTLFVGQGAGSDGTFTQTGGTFYATSQVELGSSAAGKGTWIVGGGDANALYVFLGRSASVTSHWDLSGGNVVVRNFLAMGYATGAGDISVNQSGGLLTVSNNLTMGQEQGGTHTWTQSGGTNAIGGTLLIARHNAPTTAAYHMTGGLLAITNDLTIVESWSSGTGLLHVAGTAPSIRVNGNYNQTRPTGTLELTLAQDGGMQPIYVKNTASLAGTLKIGRLNNALFAPGMVVTAMTYNARSGAFATTTFLDGLSCRVNYDVSIAGGRKAITLDQLQPRPVRGTTVLLH